VANLDPSQKRAFEVILASFLLTFFDNPDPESTHNQYSAQHNSFQRTSKINLQWLKGDRNEQLICLLHGQGSSGKSTVINLVKFYAKEYCETGLRIPFDH
jgi:hypothetical protein